jgi:protein-disulfide isomerase
MSRLVLDVGPRDHIQGNKLAPVTLVEYGDYECPYCGQAYYLVKRLQADLGGMFRLVFRNFPLTQIHPHALDAALAAEAAGLQDQFWEMHDMLFEHQDALDMDHIAAYASVLELDIEKFMDDMEADATMRRVREDFTSGVRSGVNGTPTFFVNGRRHDYWYEYRQLRGAIEQAASTVRT